MEIEAPRRRATQAIAVVVVVAGALTLVTSLAFLSGLILGDPPGGQGSFLRVLGAGLLGALLLVVGRKLLAWGSGDRG